MNEKEERMVRESIEATVKEFLLKDEKKPLISWRMYMIDGTHVGRTWTKTLDEINEFLRSYYNFHQEMFAIVVSRIFAISWASKFGSDIKDFGDRYIFIYEDIRPVGMKHFQEKKADPWDKWIEEGTKADPVKPSSTPTADQSPWQPFGWGMYDKSKGKAIYFAGIGGKNYKIYPDGVPCEEPGCIHNIIPCRGCGRLMAQGTTSKLLKDLEVKAAPDFKVEDLTHDDTLDAMRYVKITRIRPDSVDHIGALEELLHMRFYNHKEPCAHPGCKSHFSHPCEGCGRILAIGTAWGPVKTNPKKEDK